MSNYRIAELLVQIKMEGNLLIRHSNAYRTDCPNPPDIIVDYSETALQNMQKKYFLLDRQQCEYLLTGTIFYTQLLKYQGMMLHASAVAFENNAYLFSANCRTGKSTHTEQWQHFFGEQNAVIINDDKPAIRYFQGEFFAYGTPWSGKSDKNLDIKVPLRGITFIEQSPDNWIKQISPKESISLFLEQTVRPNIAENMNLLLIHLNQLLTKISVFRMGCNISEDAVQTAYNAMKNALPPQLKKKNL